MNKTYLMTKFDPHLNYAVCTIELVLVKKKGTEMEGNEQANISIRKKKIQNSIGRDTHEEAGNYITVSHCNTHPIKVYINL